MPFTDLILKTLDDQPGYFEVVGDCYWSVPDSPMRYHAILPVFLEGILVAAGYKTDLASIPFGLRNLFSKTGLSRKPAVFHDWMYDHRMFTRQVCDSIFRGMLIERGIPRWQAQVYYIGVRLGGWTRGNW